MMTRTNRGLRRHISIIALLAAAAPVSALAADFNAGAGQTLGDQTLAGGETGTVAVGGAVNDDGPAVRFSGGAGTATLTNNGRIIGTDDGERGIDSAANSGAPTVVVINNNLGAVIEGGDDAIRIRFGGNLTSLTLTNAGTIESRNGGQALDFNSLTGGAISIINEATGVIRSTDADTIRPGANATVTNRGTIRSETVGGNDPDGVDFQDFGGTVINSGIISAVRHGVTSNGFVTVDNLAGGQLIGRNGSGVNIDGDGKVTNRGTITGGCDGALVDCDGDGVDMDGVAEIENFGTISGTAAQGVGSDGLPNTSDGVAAGGGSIVNHAGATISSTSRAILIDDSSQGPAPAATIIDNAGIISGAEIGIKIVGTQNDAVTNTGTIEATAAGGIAIDLGGGDDTLNIGTGSVITGLVDGGDGVDSVVLNGTGSFAGGQNFERLSLAAGRWALTGSQAYANGIDIGAGATLAGDATITGDVTNGGTVEPGNSPGTITINGNYGQTAAGTLRSEITAGGSDLLAVNGTASLAGNHDIVIDYGTYLDGQSIDLVTATGGITGDFASITINQNGFFTVTRTVTADAETLSFQRLAFAGVAGASANASAVGAAFDAGVAAGTGGAFAALTQGLIAGGSQAQAAALFDDIAGAGDADLQVVAADAARGLAGHVFDRFGAGSSCLGSAGAAGNCFWMQGLGAFGSADSDAFSAGYDLTTAGVVFGYDRAVGGGFRVGVSGGFADSRADFDNGADGKVATFSGSIYGHLDSGAFDATVALSLAHNSLNADHAITGMGEVRGEADGFAYGIAGEAGWRFALGGNTQLRPYFGLGYDRANLDSYTQDGVAGFGQAVDPDDVETLRGRAGVDLSTSVSLGGTVAQPYLGLGVEHDFLDQQAELRRELAALPGQEIVVKGADLDRTAGTVEAGFSVAVQPGIAVFAGYDGRLAGDRQNHAGTAGLRISW